MTKKVYPRRLGWIVEDDGNNFLLHPFAISKVRGEEAKYIWTLHILHI